MNELQTTTTILGIGLTLVILYLLRRDHLYLRDALFWATVALLSLVFGLSPKLMDGLASVAGVAYSPTLFLLIAVVVLALRALMNDLAITNLRRDMRRLTQRIAILDAEISLLNKHSTPLSHLAEPKNKRPSLDNPGN